MTELKECSNCENWRKIGFRRRCGWWPSHPKVDGEDSCSIFSPKKKELTLKDVIGGLEEERVLTTKADDINSYVRHKERIAGHNQLCNRNIKFSWGDIYTIMVKIATSKDNWNSQELQVIQAKAIFKSISKGKMIKVKE